jgi:hypothetical protein
MPGTDDVRRAPRRRVLAATIAALTLAVPVAASAAPAHDPKAKTAPATKVQPKALTDLPISLNLLGMQLSVDIPLTLQGIVALVQPQSSSTPPPTSSSTPPPHHTSTPPPSTSSSTSRSRTTTPPTSQNPGGNQAVGPIVTPTSSSSSSPPPTTSSSKPSGQGGGVIQNAGKALLKLLPTNLTRLLFLLTFIAGIGIALTVIRMGQRGGRHAA